MHWKLMAKPPRGIAVLILTASMALSGQIAARISAPALGWLLSPDGSEVIGITGVVDSPRDGHAFKLPEVASRIWVSPDASALVALTAKELWLIVPGSSARQLSAAESSVSVAWDRSGNGFLVCQSDHCAEHSASGAVRGGFDTSGAASVLAYSESAGALYVRDGVATWHRASGDVAVGEAAAAAFRPGAQELWVLSPNGRLSGFDANGSSAGSADLIADAIGLAVSADGNTLVAVNASSGSVFDLRTAEVNRLAFAEGVDGLWLAPGNFAVRLHESSKRPVAFWNGETGALGWMPAAATVGEQNQ